MITFGAEKLVGSFKSSAAARSMKDSGHEKDWPAYPR